MAIEPGFQVRLGIYRIDSEIDLLRRDIWAVLAPHLHAIIEAHYDNTIKCAPYFAEKIRPTAPRSKNILRNEKAVARAVRRAMGRERLRTG